MPLRNPLNRDERSLATHIWDMVIQVRRGIKSKTLDILRMKVTTRSSRLIINIKQNVKHRGDTKASFQHVSAYRMEEEYNRRKISTLRDRVIIYILMFAVLFIYASSD